MTTSDFSAYFHRFMAKICISLFFLVSASKPYPLLITDNSAHTNQIQRDFLFNNGIQSYSPIPASSHLRQKNKPFQTNFDSNVAIRTIDYEPSAPKTNLFKLFTPFPCEAGRPAVTLRGQEERVGDGGCVLHIFNSLRTPSKRSFSIGLETKADAPKL
jgi:hypothetical protein